MAHHILKHWVLLNCNLRFQSIHQYYPNPPSAPMTSLQCRRVKVRYAQSKTTYAIIPKLMAALLSYCLLTHYTFLLHSSIHTMRQPLRSTPKITLPTRLKTPPPPAPAQPRHSGGVWPTAGVCACAGRDPSA